MRPVEPTAAPAHLPATINPAPPAESPHMRGKKGGLMSAGSHVACPTLTNNAYFKLCIFTRAFCINVRGSVADLLYFNILILCAW